MFISSMWDVKEPKHFSKRVGHEVPGVVAIFCVCLYDPSHILSFVNVWVGLGWVIYLSRGPSVLL